MNMSDTLTIPPQVIARDVGGEVVILDLASGTYFGLDAVGARIWSGLTEGQSLPQICETMLDEYEVSREALTRDMLVLVEQLAEKGLVKKAG